MSRLVSLSLADARILLCTLQSVTAALHYPSLPPRPGCQTAVLEKNNCTLLNCGRHDMGVRYSEVAVSILALVRMGLFLPRRNSSSIFLLLLWFFPSYLNQALPFTFQELAPCSAKHAGMCEPE